jgi:hypothetical protein
MTQQVAKPTKTKKVLVGNPTKEMLASEVSQQQKNVRDEMNSKAKLESPRLRKALSEYV